MATGMLEKLKNKYESKDISSNADRNGDTPGTGMLEYLRKKQSGNTGSNIKSSADLIDLAAKSKPVLPLDNNKKALETKPVPESAKNANMPNPFKEDEYVGLQVTTYGGKHKDIGALSPYAFDAIKNGHIENYKPVTDTEAKTIDSYKNYLKYGEGNIDLTNRPIYKNNDGSISTVSSISINEGGKEVLIPTIVWGEDGKAKKLTDDEAVTHYHNTGEYLGMFDTRDDADAYGKGLSSAQGMMYSETLDEEQAAYIKYATDKCSDIEGINTSHTPISGTAIKKAPDENGLKKTIDSAKDFIGKVFANTEAEKLYDKSTGYASNRNSLTDDQLAKAAINALHNSDSADSRDFAMVDEAYARLSKSQKYKDSDLVLALREAKRSWSESPIKALGLNAVATVSNMSANIASFANSLGADKLPFLKDINNQAIETSKYYQQEAARYNKGTFGKNLGSVTQGVVNLAPYFFLGAGKTAGKAALNAPKYATYIKTIANNPSFWYSLTSMWGQKYQEAIDGGVDRFTALSNAMLYSIPASLVEVGGGIGSAEMGTQKLSRTIIEELGEEIAQDVLSGASDKATSKPELPIYSTTEDAIVNPINLAETAITTIPVVAIGGGANTALNKIANLTYQRMQMRKITADKKLIDAVTNFSDTVYSTVESGDTIADIKLSNKELSQLGKFYSGDENISALITEGLECPKESNAFSLAQEIKVRRENNEKIKDIEIGKLVEANIKQIASEEHDKAPIQQTENVQALSLTVRNASADIEASDNIIPQNKSDVNTSLNDSRTSSIVFDNKKTKGESKAVLSAIAENISAISGEEKFNIVSDNNIFNYTKKSDYIFEIFKSQGNIAYNPVLGNVELGRSGAKSTIAHGFGNIKLAAVKGIKNVIENGNIISYTKNYNNSGVDRYIIAARGLIDNKDSIIGVVVKSYDNPKSKSKFYLHEVKIIEGDTPYMTAPQLSVDTVAYHPHRSNHSVPNDNTVPRMYVQDVESNAPSDNIISQKNNTVNTYSMQSTDELNGLNQYEVMDSLGLTDGEQRAILKYKSSYSYKINEKLYRRKNLLSKEQAFIETANDALDKFPVYKGIVYRNMSFDFRGREALEGFISQHSIGKSVEYPSFTSASKTTDGYVLDGELLVHIEIESYSGRDVADIGLSEEEEVLFKAGTSFEVIEVNYNGASANIVLREIIKYAKNDERVFQKAFNNENNGRDTHRAENASRKNGLPGGDQTVHIPSPAIRGRGTGNGSLFEKASDGNRRGSDRGSGKNYLGNDSEAWYDGDAERPTLREITPDIVLREDASSGKGELEGILQNKGKQRQAAEGAVRNESAGINAELYTPSSSVRGGGTVSAGIHQTEPAGGTRRVDQGNGRQNLGSDTEAWNDGVGKGLLHRITHTKSESVITELGRLLGINVVFVNDLPGKNGMTEILADGSVRITISRNADDPMMQVFKHELTHGFKKTNPDAYARYKKYCIDNMKAQSPEQYKLRFNDLWKLYCDAHGADTETGIIYKRRADGSFLRDENGNLVPDGNKRVTSDLIEDELVANVTQSFLEDESGEAFRQLAEADPVAAKGLLNQVRKLIMKLMQLAQNIGKRNGLGKPEASLMSDIEMLRQAERMWTEMLIGTVQNTPARTVSGQLNMSLENAVDTVSESNISTPDKNALYSAMVTLINGEAGISDTVAVVNARTVINEFLSRNEDISNKLKVALSSAVRKADAMMENDVTERNFSISESFSSDYDRWVKNGRPDNITLTVGTTSEALKSIGVREQKITWDASKIIASLKKHLYLNDSVLKQIPQILENPIIVMQSTGFDSRITMFGDVYDIDGLPVMAVLELLPQNRTHTVVLDEIKVVSTHSRKNKAKPDAITQTQNLINNSNILYIEPNKKRTNNWLSLNRLQLPLGQTNYGSIESITYPNGNVNTYSMQDNENNSVTEQYSVKESIDKSGKSGYNGNASHSPTKWHTDLSKTQIKEVEKWLRQVGKPETTRITDTANWYKGRIDGKPLFVIYSTEDANSPTILYERKGEEAKAELDALQRMLEVIENGDIQKQRNIDRLLSGDWVQEKHDMAHSDDRPRGGGSDTGYASVLQRESSQFIGSRAFRNVLENLFREQERDGRLNELSDSLDESVTDYSLKEAEAVKELEKAVDTVSESNISTPDKNALYSAMVTLINGEAGISDTVAVVNARTVINEFLSRNEGISNKLNVALSSAVRKADAMIDRADFSVKEGRYAASTLSQEEFESNSKQLVEMDNVANLVGNEMDGDKPLKEKIIDLFKDFGSVVHTEKFGDIALTNSSIRSEIRHGSTREKVTSYAAIPQVLQNGVVINIQQKNYGEVERIIIAAPISISGSPYFMGAMIQRDRNSKRLYLHDVVIKKEASEYQSEHLNTTGPLETKDLYITEVLEKAISVGYSISQNSPVVKKNSVMEQYSVKENINIENLFKANEKDVQKFSYQVDRWLSGKMPSNELFEIGTTPAVLQALCKNKLPVKMAQNVMLKITGLKHDISIDDIKRIPDALADPIMIFDSATVKNAFVIFTELTDKHGNEVVIALHLNRSERHIKINRITSVYGKENISSFVLAQIKEGKLRYYDKSKSLLWSQSRGLQLPKLADTIKGSNNIILQKADIVNTYSMQDNENNSEMEQYSVKENQRDADYMNAVNSRDMEAAQKLVDEAAKEAGYNSPMLYHGTNAFGFTQFDLSKMDDKQTIFLTNSNEIASTYSGAEGERKISDVYGKDIVGMSLQELVDELNQFTNDDEKASYSVYDLPKLNKLIEAVNIGIDDLSAFVDKKLAEYKEIASWSDERIAYEVDKEMSSLRIDQQDSEFLKSSKTTFYKESVPKLENRLSALKEKLNSYDYNNLSSPIYYLIHYTGVFGNDSEKYAELEKNIRLMNKLRVNDNITDGVIVKEFLDGYSIEVLTEAEAKDALTVRTKEGNYSVYAKMENPLIIEGTGRVWNDIRNWSDALIPPADELSLVNENNAIYLVDKKNGRHIPGAVMPMTPVVQNADKKQLIAFLRSEAKHIWAIRTESIKNTRGICKVAKEHSFDSVIFKNIRDNGGRNFNVDYETTADIYALFNPNNVKSADAVTYNNDGNIIPLSERFNDDDVDIRYSVKESIDKSGNSEYNGNEAADRAIPAGSMINEFHGELSSYEWYKYYQHVNNYDWDSELRKSTFDFYSIIGNKLIKSKYSNGKPSVEKIYIHDSGELPYYDEGVIYDNDTKRILEELTKTTESIHKRADDNSSLAVSGKGSTDGGIVYADGERINSSSDNDIPERTDESVTDYSLKEEAVKSGKSGYNGNASHSPTKWHTDLSKTQIKEVEKWLRQEANREDKRITDTANWYNGRIDGKPLFVIYSSEDINNPTILYEVSGEKANLERGILMDLLEDEENGKSINGKPSFTQRVSEGSWMQNVDGSQNNLRYMGSERNNQNAGVLQGQSQRNGSRAFRNVIENLFREQERDGRLNELSDSSDETITDYSIKEAEAAKELEKAVKILKENFKLVPGEAITQEHARKLAFKYLSRYGKGYDVKAFADELADVINYALKKNPENDVYALVKDLCSRALSESASVDTDTESTYKPLRELLREGVNVSDEIRSDITDYGEFRKSMFGKIILKRDGGMAVDTKYAMLCEEYPELFDPDIINPTDQLLKMAEVAEAIKPRLSKTYLGNDAAIDEASDYMAAEIMGELIPTTWAKNKQIEYAYRVKEAVRKEKIAGEKKLEVLKDAKKEADKLKKQLEIANKKLEKFSKQRTDKKRRSYLTDVLNKLSSVSSKEEFDSMRGELAEDVLNVIKNMSSESFKAFDRAEDFSKNTNKDLKSARNRDILKSTDSNVLQMENISEDIGVSNKNTPIESPETTHHGDYTSPEYETIETRNPIVATDFKADKKRRADAAKQYGLSTGEANNLARYVGGPLCYPLNKKMNEGTLIGREVELVADIRNALLKMPEYSGRTYRNLEFETKKQYNDFLSEYAEGNIVKLKAFTSASKLPNGYPLFGNGVVHLVIDGVSGRDIADTFGLPRQQEVIYLPDTAIEIKKVMIANDGKPLIFAQEVKANDNIRTKERGNTVNNRPASSMYQGVNGQGTGLVRNKSNPYGVSGEVRNRDRRNVLLSEWGKSTEAGNVPVEHEEIKIGANPDAAVNEDVTDVNGLTPTDNIIPQDKDIVNSSIQLIEDYSSTVDDILSVSDEDAKKLADKRTAVEVLKNTPDVILNNVKDAKDLKVIMNYNKLYLAVRKNGVFKGHYHNLGAEIAKMLPDFLKNPDAIIQLGNGRLNLFSTVKTERGNNGIVSVELNSTKDIGGKYEDYNVIVTMFSSDDNYAENLISGEGVTVKYKREDLSQVNPQLYKWLAIINDKSSTDNIIPQDKDIVNSSIRSGGEDYAERTRLARKENALAEEIENADASTVTAEEMRNLILNALDFESEVKSYFNEKIEKYGAVPKGENSVRDVNLPNKLSDTEAVSRFARTMMEAKVTPDFALSEFEKAILDGSMTHEIITDKKALKKAQEDIRKNGYAEELDSWTRLANKGKVGKNDFVLGLELYNQAITNKDIKTAMKLAVELASEATRAGQTLQATRLLKKMSPDGQLYYIEKSVQKMNEEFKETLGGKFKEIELDEKLMERFFNEKDEEKRNAVYDEICQNIADQIPATLGDKWNSWRYLAMLGNPRTHIRNILGNAVFLPAIRMKNFTGAVMEAVVGVSAEERIKSIFKSKESIEFAKKDFEVVLDSIKGVNAKYAVTGDIEEKRTIFKTKWLEKLRVKNFEFLEAEDMWFLKVHYTDALARAITARKVDVNSIDPVALEALRAYAIKEAQAATYRDANELAEALNKMQRKARMSDKKLISASGLLIEGVMPFKKTPLNIAKQGINYSPIGILKGTYKALKRIKDSEAFDVTEVIDDLAKGLTGTGVMLLGTFLASMGFLTGGDEEDKKKRSFDKMTGEQSYSVNIGNSTYTIDWATPLSLPLFTGVELWKSLSEGKFSFGQAMDALSTLPEPLLELSVLSGVSDAIESAQYDDTNVIFAVASDMVTNYALQAFPTVGGQASRIIDENRKEYYYHDKNKGMPKILNSFIGQAASKIPGASYLFETSVDDWGRERTYGGPLSRIFGNLASPGYYSQLNYTEVDKELNRLYEATGDNDVFPIQMSKKYTIDDKEYNLTAKQYTEMKKLRGKKSFERVQLLIKTEVYKNLSDEDKVKKIYACYQKAGDETKKEFIEKYVNE